MERFGIPQAFASYEDLLAQEVDAVSIASPIGLHYEQGRQALQPGKHVHFNKTMTTTVDEASELIETARARASLVASPGGDAAPAQPADQGAAGRGGPRGARAWAVPAGGVRDVPRERGGAPGDPQQHRSFLATASRGAPLYDTTVYACTG